MTVTHLQSAVQDDLAACQTVVCLIGEAPVPNQELQLLEGLVPAVLQSQSAVLREELSINGN